MTWLLQLLQLLQLKIDFIHLTLLFIIISFDMNYDTESPSYSDMTSSLTSRSPLSSSITSGMTSRSPLSSSVTSGTTTRSPLSSSVTSRSTPRIYNPATDSDWPSSVFENTRSRTKSKSSSGSDTGSETETRSRTNSNPYSDTDSDFDSDVDSDFSLDGYYKKKYGTTWRNSYILPIMLFYLPGVLVLSNMINIGYDLHNQPVIDSLKTASFAMAALSLLASIVSKFRFSSSIVLFWTWVIYLISLYLPFSLGLFNGTLSMTSTYLVFSTLVVSLSILIVGVVDVVDP